MPIYGDSLKEVANEFRGHLNSLLAKTITLTPVMPMFVYQEVDGEHKEVAILGFPRKDGRPGSAELNTKYGPMNLYLGQTCDTVQDEGQRQLQLRTISYAYSLQPLMMDDQMVRWEYVKFPGEDSYWSRHHVQGPITFQIPEDDETTHSINMNDWHLPTGWVTIEDVIRFCLHDLGAKALSEPRVWHNALIESTDVFRTQFARIGEI